MEHVWSFLRKPCYVDFGLVDNLGRTPLVCAEQSGHTAIAELLTVHAAQNAEWQAEREAQITARADAARRKQAAESEQLAKETEHAGSGP